MTDPNQGQVEDNVGLLVRGDYVSDTNRFPVEGVLVAGDTEEFIGRVGGSIVTVSATFARPADTTAYTAKDVVGTSPATVLTFANMARVVGGSGYITKCRIMTDDAAIASLPVMRLHLFKVSPTAIADNSPYTTLYANRSNRLGEIDLPILTLEGSGSDAVKSIAVAGTGNLPLPFVCDAASRSIFAILETTTAFTPASSKNWFVELTADQN